MNSDQADDMQKIVIAITGASGAVYAMKLLQKMIRAGLNRNAALIFSLQGAKVWEYELGSAPVSQEGFAIFSNDDLFAAPASGSAGYAAMIICPCSMGTLGRISSGVSTDLISRAADVMLKEKRPLVLVPREMPYNLIHLRNMSALCEAGAVICPASPSFYARPATADEIIETVTDKVLSLAGFPYRGFRWGTPD